MNAHTYSVEYTDTFNGETNYSWVRRATVSVPELTHYGYDGSRGYAKANRAQRQELMRRAKAAVGLTGVRGVTTPMGDGYEFRPYGCATVLFVSWQESEFMLHTFHAQREGDAVAMLWIFDDARQYERAQRIARENNVTLSAFEMIAQKPADDFITCADEFAHWVKRGE